MSRTLSAKEKANEYSFATWIYTAHRSEFDHFMRYGTPSDELVELANEYKLMGQDPRWVLLPYSLSTSKGQKAFHIACTKVQQWSRMIPYLAYETLSLTASEVAAHRRTEASRANAMYVAEAILYRCAAEFTNQVIFSMDLIAAWVSHAFNIRFDAMTVQRALKWWSTAEGSPFEVVEWGTKGNTSRATKIRVHLNPVSTSNRSPRERIVSNTSVDTWLDTHAHAMEYIYKLQGHRAQHYAEVRAEHAEKRAMERATKLLKVKDAVLVPAQRQAPSKAPEIKSEPLSPLDQHMRWVRQESTKQKELALAGIANGLEF